MRPVGWGLVLLFAVASASQAAIRVTARYVNYFDPTGKQTPVVPKDMAVLHGPALPPAPRTLSPGYPNDPQNVNLGHVYREPDGRRVLRLAYMSPYPTDTVPSFMDWKTWYQVSNDGGKTMSALRPMIQQGRQCNLMHPIGPVTVGKNSFVPSTAPPVRASNGKVMVPFYFPPLDAEGKYYNPVGAYTFSDAGVLIGTWNADGNDLTWDLGETVRIEADQSTRGCDEPAVMELKTPGKFMMVIRASNDRREETVPGYKYVAVSRDFCRTWSKPEPMRYSDGKPFYSPSACSELVRSVKNGRLYWIGNIARTPAHGNHPRYPLVIGEIDEDTLGLIRDSVVVIDDRNPEIDSKEVQLSNFTTSQDPATGQLVVRLVRFDRVRGGPKKPDGSEPAAYPPCAYVIEVD